MVPVNMTPSQHSMTSLNLQRPTVTIFHAFTAYKAKQFNESLT